MRFLLVCLTFYLSFLSLNAQTLNGKIYDSKTTIKGVKVLNDTQNRVTATDAEGNFSIVAKVRDTLLFESLFHHPKVVILNASHFKAIAVFELEQIVNELDEVEIQSEPEQPVFKEETYNIELQNLIKEDIKRNPGLYQSPNATYGVDFVYLIGQIAKLFKRKNKKPIYQPITYTQMDSLFRKSSFFTTDLITKDLKIPETRKYLFFEFCVAKQMSSELLTEKKKMELLEKLVLNSQLFLFLLEEYGTEEDTQD
ncbi:hypothetical protein [Winogradskyella sp.]|uniref:hypothetical protein n=1 Tax=Winogradskyella sp. TaxID=1883156 RepID=UPI003F6D4E92